LRNFRGAGAYQILEDLMYNTLHTLAESLFAALTLVAIYGDRNWGQPPAVPKYSAFAIVPAAGVSARMGQPKLLLRLEGRTIIERTIDAWQRSGVARVFVVLRADHTELATLAASSGATVVIAEPPPEDMKASVRAGLEFITRGEKPRSGDVWLTAPADLPALSAEAARRLLAAHNPRSPKVLVAAHRGRAGHPVLFPWSWAPNVANLASDEGLNSLVEQAGAELVECGAEAIGRDLDTPADYERWQSTSKQAAPK
jgi:CTP:molybdopterin cytidylyltransferase MocA